VLSERGVAVVNVSSEVSKRNNCEGTAHVNDTDVRL
jgi:hypothetical protein